MIVVHGYRLAALPSLFAVESIEWEGDEGFTEIRAGVIVESEGVKGVVYSISDTPGAADDVTKRVSICWFNGQKTLVPVRDFIEQKIVVLTRYYESLPK